MHLKGIEIQGFKSFGDKAHIEFSPGITAIVGPNGSGKSNVADAVRWVLGEQSARALRGAKMEDIIFSGTKERKPLSFCEVVLTFDNADGGLPLEYTEVAVSRRLYRSGESEYAINRSPCRMRDILSLFYDTGVGRDGYSIIGQGKIEEILSQKGEERRAAFEEAAGVMKYKVNKQEAQRKLANVENSMVRVADIMAELEGNLEPLFQQSQAAREFLELQSRLRELDITLFADQYERNTGRVRKLEEEIQSLERLGAEAKDRETALREEEDLHREKLALMDGLLETAQEKRFQLAQAASAAQREQELAAQRHATLEETLNRLEGEAERDRLLLEGVEQALGALSGTKEADTQGLQTQLDALILQREEIRNRLSDLEARLDREKQAHLDALAKEGEKKSILARQAAILEQAGVRLAQINQALDQQDAERNQLMEEQSGVRWEREAAGAELERLRSAREALVSREAALRERLQTADTAIAQEAEKARAADHRATIQRDLKRNYEGYSQTVRLLMQDVKEKGQPVSRGVYGPVGDLIKTEAQYEKAIGQALSAAAQNIVAEDEATGKALIAHLRRMDYGRATFLPLAALRPRTFGGEISRYLSMDGAIGPAMDLVRFDPAIVRAVEYLLGRTLIVRDMDAGIAIARAAGNSFRCVTLLGDILNPGGTMTGGSNRDRGFLSRDRLIAEAEQQRDECLYRVESYQAKRQELAAEQHKAAQELEALSAGLQDGRVLEAQILEKADAIAYQLERVDQETARLATERQRIAVMMEEAAPKEEQDHRDVEALAQEVLELTRQVAALRQEAEGVEGEIVTRQVNLSALLGERSAAEKERGRLTRERDRLVSAIAAGRESLKVAKQELALLEERTADRQRAKDSANTQMSENDAALEQLSRERQRLDILIREALAHREEIAGAAAENRDRRYRMGNQRERLLAETEALETRMWNDYQITFAMAQESRLEIKTSAAVAEAGSIRNRMAEMGTVNPGAIEEYNRVRERYDFLTEQNADLLKAKEDLQRLIDDLMGEMQERFIGQFQIINQNFQRTFQALFKGGEARLELSDENNAMECNIEIIAQPPGKRLQNISLLSGGERALTAIAILFAMLDLKATPFCILDEIETALDDENLRLFADYLGNYAQKTQFIAITHRRPTMEAASALYGVTMEEKGVSKLVSVRFEDVG
ncbi:chromosome segregation protein SMC [Christensenella sp. MSJ-20]|uniref:chromosome segregation protein SMC n=1 Tax=Christensenella sp. MSJ-20 TaxID=2841518 RepID=UPI001C7921E8|nr:chromosome segregation protein SMC [Christensenella sp. MSJ-20]